MSFKAKSLRFVSTLDNWGFIALVFVLAGALVWPLAREVLPNGQRAGLSDDPRLDMLLHGIVEGDLTQVQHMLAKGVDVNQLDRLGQRPLVHAAQVAGPDNFRIVDLLIEHGADEDCPDAAGSTPLLIATCFNNRPAAIMLLRAGANPNAANSFGMTPIGVARNSEQTMMIELLEDHASDSLAQAR